MTNQKKALYDRLKDDGLLLNNALANPDIISELNNYNYKEARLIGLKSQLEKVIHLTEHQKKEYGDQYQATETLDKTREKAEIAYKTSLKLARIAFRNYPGAAGALLLDGIRKKTVSGFLEQARTFYNNLLESPELLAVMANYNCNRAKLTDELELVDLVSSAFEKQQKERGDALQATRERDQILDSFELEITDLSAICKIAFAGREDILTALGL